jgi:hypothetical protein
MKTQTVILKVEKSVNDANEVQPNLYTVIDDDAYFYSDGDKHWIDHSPETLGVSDVQD